MSTQLSIQLDRFNFDKKDENLLIDNGFFRIRRKNKYYIVTCHNFLPIKNNIFLNSQKLKICINSNWNELLVLKEDIFTKDIKTFDKISSRLPPIGETLLIDDKKIKVDEYCFKDSFFIPGFPKVVYMKIKIKDSKKIKSGIPIFCSQNKLQGIVSHSDINYIYCLPSYFLKKTFEMENKFSVPIINDKIEKINRNCVKDNFIFNPYLGLHLPVLTYLFLERNRNLDVCYKGNVEETTKVVYREFVENKIQNKRHLVSLDDFYMLSTSSLHLLNILNKKHASRLFKIMNSNPNLSFKIDKDYLILK